MSWDGLDHADVSCTESEHDTRRFGFPVARLTVGEHAVPGPELVAAVGAAIESCAAAVIVGRWPARMTELAGHVAGLGRRVIPADTLTYWDVPTSELIIRAQVGDELETRAGVDAGDLDDVLRDSFRDYPSHYTANPAFAPALVLDGYLEWARRTLETRSDDVVTLLRGGRAIGFATCLTAHDASFLEIELAGLATAEQGGGRYATLLHGVGLLAQSRDIPRVVISTQASNIRVQRAWTRVGMSPYAAFTTVHLTQEHSTR